MTLRIKESQCINNINMLTKDSLMLLTFSPPPACSRIVTCG